MHSCRAQKIVRRVGDVRFAIRLLDSCRNSVPPSRKRSLTATCIDLICSISYIYINLHEITKATEKRSERGSEGLKKTLCKNPSRIGDHFCMQTLESDSQA